MKTKIHQYLNLKTWKTGRNIALIVLLSISVLTFQNCKPTEPEPEPEPVDTVKKTKVEPVNGFKFNNITTYTLAWDSTNMYARYRVNTQTTSILVDGMMGTKAATFQLRFPGNKIGTFIYSIDPIVDVEVTTGSNVTYKQYKFPTGPSSAGKNMIINVTKYDPVGGHVQGTFSADLQESASITTGTISAGKFDVWRQEDE